MHGSSASDDSYTLVVTGNTFHNAGIGIEVPKSYFGYNDV